jgi:hypothetical protein
MDNFIAKVVLGGLALVGGLVLFDSYKRQQMIPARVPVTPQPRQPQHIQVNRLARLLQNGGYPPRFSDN